MPGPDQLADLGGGVAEHLPGGHPHADGEQHDERDAPGDTVHDVSPPPARPGDAGGQHRLQRPVGLVDPHPQQHLDEVDGDEHAGHLDDRDPVGIDDPVRAARLGPPVAGVALDVLDLLGEAAEDQAEHRQRRPPSRGTPRAGVATPARPGSAACGRASPWPRRSGHSPRPTSLRAASATAVATSNAKAATAIASGHQWLPPNGRVCCPHPIGESHTGQALVTCEPGAVDGAQHVADPAERERDAEGPRGDAGGTASGGGQLAGHRRDADPDHSDGGHRGAGQQRALDGLAVDGDRQPRSRGPARRSLRRPRPWPRPGRRTARRPWRRASRRDRAPRSGGCAGSTAKVLISAASTASVRYSRCSR